MSSVIIVLDLDPCNNASCLYHSKPVAYSSQQCDCVCETRCPSYRDEICASNGRTFRNDCLLKKEICEKRANYTRYHPGSCLGMFCDTRDDNDADDERSGDDDDDND